MVYLVAVIGLGVLIFVHELGHFLVAKWNNVGVVAFAIGFGPKIFSKKVGETEYSLRIIPLGGYVRMVGDDPRELDPEWEGGRFGNDLIEGKEDSSTELSAEERALLEDRSRWFLTQGFWAKAAIVIAGPLANYLFAIVLAVASIWLYGINELIDQPVIARVMEGEPAQQAGIEDGDRVLLVDGNEVETWTELASRIADSEGQPLELLIERSGAVVEPIEVRAVDVSDRMPQSEDGKKIYKIGIAPTFERMSVGVGEAFSGGAKFVWFLTERTVQGFAGMLMGAISPKHLAGPIFIFTEAGKSAEQGADSFLSFIVFLSVTLAILNLLPIPILDGGHLLFFIIEALTGSPLSIRVREISSQVGALMLLLLILVSVGNDVMRLVSG